MWLLGRRRAFSSIFRSLKKGPEEAPYNLRADYQRARGANYTLEGFHNDFIRQGGIPIPLVRRILLPGDRGPAL